MRRVFSIVLVLVGLALAAIAARTLVFAARQRESKARRLLARARVAQEAADWTSAARLYADATSAGAGRPARFGAFLAQAHLPESRGIPVRSAADVGFDPDGTPLAALLGRSGLHLVDLRSGALVPWLTEHPRAESASLEDGCLVARSRDEAFVLARAGGGVSVSRFAVASDAPFSCTDDPKSAVVWRAGGLFALSAAGDAHRLQAGAGAASLHTAGGRVFVRTADGVLTARDVRTGALLGRRGGVGSVFAPSPDGLRVAWVEPEGVREGPAEGSGAWLVAARVRASRLSWSEDGALLAACGIDPVVRVLDPRRHRLEQTLFGGVSVCAVSGARREVLAGGRLYGLPPPEPRLARPFAPSPVCLDPAATLCVRSRSGVSVEADAAGTISLRTSGPAGRSAPQRSLGGEVRALAVEAGGRRAFVATRSRPWLYAVPLDSNLAPRAWGVPAPPAALAWDDARKLLAVGLDDGEVVLLDEDGLELGRLPSDGLPVAALALSADGRMLLIDPGEGGTVRAAQLPPP